MGEESAPVVAGLADAAAAEAPVVSAAGDAAGAEGPDETATAAGGGGGGADEGAATASELRALLARERARFDEERRVAFEAFAQTVAGYEQTISALENGDGRNRRGSSRGGNAGFITTAQQFVSGLVRPGDAANATTASKATGNDFVTLSGISTIQTHPALASSCASPTPAEAADSLFLARKEPAGAAGGAGTLLKKSILSLRHRLAGDSTAAAAPGAAATDFSLASSELQSPFERAGSLSSDGGGPQATGDLPPAAAASSVATWVNILQAWNEFKGSKRVMRALAASQGIPPSLRRALWVRALTEKTVLTRQLYKFLVIRALVTRGILHHCSPRYSSRVRRIFALANGGGDSAGGRGENDVTIIIPESHGAGPAGFVRDLERDGDSYWPQIGGEQPDGVPSGDESSKYTDPGAYRPPSQADSPGSRFPTSFTQFTEVVTAGGAKLPVCTRCASLVSPPLRKVFETLAGDLHRTMPMESRRRQGSSRRRRSVSRETGNGGATARSSAVINPNGGCAAAAGDTSSLSTSGLGAVAPPSAAAATSVESLFRLLPATPRRNSTATTASSDSPFRPTPRAGCQEEQRQQLTHYSRLRLLLETFALQRPDIGYTQGMAHLGSVVVTWVPDDFEAFDAFYGLVVGRPILRALFTINEKLMQVHFAVFDLLLLEKLPHASRALEQANIVTSQFLVEWFFSLFTRCLPPTIVYEVWDRFILLGDFVLFQTALTLLKFVVPPAKGEGGSPKSANTAATVTAAATAAAAASPEVGAAPPGIETGEDAENAPASAAAIAPLHADPATTATAIGPDGTAVGSTGTAPSNEGGGTDESSGSPGGCADKLRSALTTPQLLDFFSEVHDDEFFAVWNSLAVSKSHLSRVASAAHERVSARAAASAAPSVEASPELQGAASPGRKERKSGGPGGSTASFVGFLTRKSGVRRQLSKKGVE